MDSFYQKKYDNFAEFDAKDFEFLYQSSSKLIDIDSKNELFNFISSSLNVYGNFVVLANEYDPFNKEMILLSTSGLDKYIDIVIDVLGRRLKGFKTKVDDKRVDIVLNNKFIEIEGGVYNLVEKSIPKNVCLFLEKLVGVKYVYLMGLIDKKSLLGNVVLLSKEKITNNQINVIKYFLYSASMAFQKVKKEEELIFSNKMLELRVEERTAELNKLLEQFKNENEKHKLTQMNWKMQRMSWLNLCSMKKS